MAELDKYYMELAKLIASRSSDPKTKVGACIVNNDNKIVGVGYNAMPQNKDTEYTWGKDPDDPVKNKHSYVCHAELNAIMNSFSSDLKGCTMYVTLHPCNQCAKLIAQSGITEIIYDDIKPDIWETLASQRILETSGIKLRQYRLLA